MAMQCPRCSGYLVKDEYDDLGRYYCLSCGYDAYPRYRPPAGGARRDGWRWSVRQGETYPD